MLNGLNLSVIFSQKIRKYCYRESLMWCVHKILQKTNIYRAYQEVRNVRFLQYFAYAVNE